MPFILRDEQGKITRASVRALYNAEFLPHSNAEVIAFLSERGEDPKTVEGALTELRQSDGDMARAIEDVIAALLKKNVLKMGDLPKPVQERISMRVKLRVLIQQAYDQASGHHGYSSPVPSSSDEIGV